MGCACGKGKGGSTIAQAARAARTPLGSAPSPLTLGDATEDVRRVRVIRPVANLRRGNAYYVNGSDVDDLIAAGDLVDITKVQQRRRQYRVGAFTYSDLQTASRVAAAQGTTPIEVA